MRGLEAIMSIGRDPFREPWFINCGSSPERANIRLGVTMCLTRSRPHGHWITNRGRYMNVEELMRLQGFPLELPVACDTFAVWPVVGQQHVC